MASYQAQQTHAMRVKMAMDAIHMKAQQREQMRTGSTPLLFPVTLPASLPNIIQNPGRPHLELSLPNIIQNPAKPHLDEVPANEVVEVAPKKSTAGTGKVAKEAKKKIPKHIKTLVWNKYIGASVASAKCMCCREADIYVRSFDCGHVIAEAKGGDGTINNMRPICRDCNHAMGTRSMNEFTAEFFGWTV